MTEARRGKVDVICVWSLDRFGRSLAHVVAAVQELHERGVAFVSLKEGLDLSTAAGRLQLHILSALGEFERARLIERTNAGLARARRQGTRLGRRPVRLSASQFATVAGLPVRDAACQLGVSVNTYRRAVCQQTPPARPENPPAGLGQRQARAGLPSAAGRDRSAVLGPPPRGRAAEVPGGVAPERDSAAARPSEHPADEHLSGGRQ